MGKKYVVDGATLSCSLGVCKTKLIVPAHRHIYMTGKRMANKLDVNLVEHCIGSFGFCRRSSPPPVCTFNILLPWQDTQEDVFGAKQDGVLETSWTCCIFGGRIKIVETGQGAGSAETALKNIQELEKCATTFAGKGASKQKINELVCGMVLWGEYEQTPWESTTNKDRMEFANYLKKENPELSEFCSQKIEIEDTLDPGNIVDISYLAGALQMDKKRSDKYIYAMTEEALSNSSQMSAYADAYIIERDYGKDSMLFSEMLQQYYNIGEEEQKTNKNQYRRYENLLKPTTPTDGKEVFAGGYTKDTVFEHRYYGSASDTENILTPQLSFGDGIENVGGHIAHYLFPELMEEQKGEAPWKRSSEAYAYNTTDEHIEQVRKTIHHNYEEEKKKRVSDSMKKNKK